MMELKRLNGTKFMLNPDLIEQVESTPDTVITLVTGNNIPVQQSMEEVRAMFLAYKKDVEKSRKEKQEAHF